MHLIDAGSIPAGSTKKVEDGDQIQEGAVLAEGSEGSVVSKSAGQIFFEEDKAIVRREEVEEREPEGNECPEDKKLNIGLLICSIALDCESAEFGCSAGAAVSIKRNFKNKSTTTFLGVGAEAGLGFARGEATAGVTMTRHANGDLDVGVKGELTGTVGVGPGSAGKNYELNVTVMEGVRTESKDVIGIGF